jgi:glycerol-1-phosphate dehydrogenase [NAD(P)+]
VEIGDNVVPHLACYLEANGLKSIVLVADTNTWRVQGEAIDRRLRESGVTVRPVVLAGEEVGADARHILRVLLACDRTEDAFLAVGSGTITDIARFVSHRSRSRFLSVPTAPSVDGYTSVAAPLVADGIKLSAQAHPPEAIFAELGTLCASPRPMIAAGLGDMLAKHTSVADWRLGRLLWDLPYDEPIAQRFLAAAQSCEALAPDLAHAGREGVRTLLEALIESGYCMLDFGASLPASGSEHHLSHYWEMELLRTSRRAILHGAKVGVATVMVAGVWERIRATSAAELKSRLESARLPARDVVVRKIRDAFGDAADGVLQAQKRFLALDEAAFEKLKTRIRAGWDEIQAIGRQVPPAQYIAGLVRAAGGPTRIQELGLTEDDGTRALGASHYLRDHFTVRRLASLLFADP